MNLAPPCWPNPGSSRSLAARGCGRAVRSSPAGGSGVERAWVVKWVVVHGLIAWPVCGVVHKWAVGTARAVKCSCKQGRVALGPCCCCDRHPQSTVQVAAGSWPAEMPHAVWSHHDARCFPPHGTAMQAAPGVGRARRQLVSSCCASFGALLLQCTRTSCCSAHAPGTCRPCRLAQCGCAGRPR